MVLEAAKSNSTVRGIWRAAGEAHMPLQITVGNSVAGTHRRGSLA